jgi:short-subunit dehydrogenase
MQLAGKVVAVTGAASGIGRALALAFARERARLALADRNEEGLSETARLVAADGAVATTHALDVADETAVRAFADDVVREHETADVVVNNAGVSIVGTVAELQSDEIAWLMNINFWGVVYGTKAFLPVLVGRPEACIVNVSSLFGIWAPPAMSAYAASKFAVRGFTESLRGELAGTNVHVMLVHPGGIRTSIATNSRIARAADVAEAKKRSQAFHDRFLTRSPEAAASSIVTGIKKRRDRVLVGGDAARADLLVRLFPKSAPRWLNRRAERLGAAH